MAHAPDPGTPLQVPDDMVGVIMAGGTGSRFWPASTERRPKQFLSLFGEHSARVGGSRPPGPAPEPPRGPCHPTPDRRSAGA